MTKALDRKLLKNLQNKEVARLESVQNLAEPREQAGFSIGFSTMDDIRTVRELVEKRREYNLPLCLAFIDYPEAFDSVYASTVVKSLEDTGIDKPDLFTAVLESVVKKLDGENKGIEINGKNLSQLGLK